MAVVNAMLFSISIVQCPTDITANNANDKVHAASFALTAHNAVGNVADENTCEYWPSREICNVF